MFPEGKSRSLQLKKISCLKDLRSPRSNCCLQLQPDTQLSPRRFQAILKLKMQEDLNQKSWALETTLENKQHAKTLVRLWDINQIYDILYNITQHNQNEWRKQSALLWLSGVQLENWRQAGTFTTLGPDFISLIPYCTSQLAVSGLGTGT